MNCNSPRLKKRRDDNRACRPVNLAHAGLPSRADRRIVRFVGYAILFRQFPLEQLDALAPIIAEIYGINDYDARMKIRGRLGGSRSRDATKGKTRSGSWKAVGDAPEVA